MTLGPTAIYDIEVQLLECIRLKLIEFGLPVPCKICVTPGEIVWDVCTNEGQLMASTVSVYYSNVFPLDDSQDATTSTVCAPGLTTADITISLMRCAPTVKGNPPRPPSCDELSSVSLGITQDSYAMRMGLLCCLNDMRNNYQIVDYRLGAATVTGPEGGCIGNTISLFVGVTNG